MFDMRNAPVCDFNKRSPFRAGLPDAAPLKIARINNVRGRAQYLPGVNMAECPVVIAMIGELLERAGGIARVPFAPATSRMQQADVEKARHRSGILQRDVFRDVALRKAPAMDGSSQLLDHHGLRPPGRKKPHIRIFQPAGKPVFGIMIASNEDHPDASLPQPAHAADEEQASAVVTPLPIEDVSGDYDQPALLLDRERDEIVERLPRGIIETRRVILRLFGQAGERTVEMQIGGMEETETSHCLSDAKPQLCS